MTKEKFLRHLSRWGTLAAAVILALPDMAWAQGQVQTITPGATDQGIGTMLREVTANELVSIPFILSAIAYIGGAILAISGAMSLKRHAENPTGEKVSIGIGRLVAGGAIAMIPFLLGTLQASTNLATNAEMQVLDTTTGFTAP